MKLPMPTPQEITNIANACETPLSNTNSVSCRRAIVENAIRLALSIVVDRMDIQIPQPIGLDLSKV